jgi:DNA-binding beta-propeller fold protein YncE
MCYTIFGCVYVTDLQNRTQIFDSTDQSIAQWCSRGKGDGQFFAPQGVGVDRHDNVYIADTSNHRIQKFTSDGKFITKWGSRGSDNGQFDFLIGMQWIPWIMCMCLTALTHVFRFSP